jgi:predicted RNA-binding Zn-ribbon protein involved in translation (DUF1610 family)
MAVRQSVVIAYACPSCGKQTVVNREEGPKPFLEWENTLWLERTFVCTSCNWSAPVAHVPVGNKA